MSAPTDGQLLARFESGSIVPAGAVMDGLNEIEARDCGPTNASEYGWVKPVFKDVHPFAQPYTSLQTTCAK